MNKPMQSTVEEKEQAQELLNRYVQAPSIELRNELVMRYSYIAKTVASQMRGITSSYADVEDIVNNGIITLIDCIEKFDPAKSGSFEPYAYSRIKCANIDFVRKQDWLPRRVRKNARDISGAYDELSNKLMRVPSAKELAEHLGVEEDVIYKHYREISNSVLLSFESLLYSVSNDSPLDTESRDDAPDAGIMREELHTALTKAVDELPERERLVISLYYHEHLKLHEIAKVLNVSEARVCQTRSRAVQRLREYLKDFVEV